MGLMEFARHVRLMRTAQREYFKTKLPGVLAVARYQERRVDRALKEILDDPLPIFDSQTAPEPPKTAPGGPPESP